MSIPPEQINPDEEMGQELPQDQSSHPLEPMMGSLLENQDEHAGTTHSLLENGVEQRDQTNQLLENQIEQSANNTEKITEAVEKLVPSMKAVDFLQAFMAQLKGDKGDPGDTPTKGVDYFTPDEIEQMSRSILAMIRVPEDGKTPIKGEDYFTQDDIDQITAYIQSKVRVPKDGKPGQPGKNAEVDYPRIIKEVLAKMPKPKDGKPGTNGSEIGTKELLEKLKGQLSFNDLKDLPNFYKPTGGGSGYLREISDVAISNPTNGQALVYNSATGKWINSTISSGGGAWGTITGTLSAQTDLQAALDAKVAANAGITGATKTKITYDAKGLVTAGTDATTADIADSTNRRYVTDAQLTVIGNTSGTNTGDQDLSGLLVKANNLSDLTNAGTARTNLGLVIGTNVQAFNQNLADIAGLADPNADRILFWDDSAGALKYLTLGTNLTITGTTIDAAGGAAAAWGAITGTLSDQTDLQTALDGKVKTDQTVGQTIGTTGARLTKLWATDITVTNAISGSVTGNAGTATALQNARTIGGVSFDGTANITVATATGGFTVSGGDLALGTNNLTMTGIIGSTGSRVTKLWATDITVTNAISGSVTGNAGTATALQNARTIGGVSFDGTANITVSTATAGFTVSGGNLALGTNSLTLTGSIGATGARATKVWATDIESTNMPTVGGTAILTSLTAPQFTTIELGHASDTTISRSSAGVIAVEGVVVDTISAANTLTNKTLTTPVINGTITGTGQATAATASTIAMRDSNANLTANNWLGGYTTTATAAGTTTLTVGSTYAQFFTGSTTQTVTLPVASTLTLGHQFLIVNNSTGAVTVNSSGGNAVLVLAGGTNAIITCILTSGTNAASWSASYSGVSVTSGKKLSVSNSLTLAGTDGTTMTFPSSSGTVVTLDATQTLTNKSIAETQITFTDVTTGNASTSNHGFLKKLSNSASQYMDGTGNWSTPSSAPPKTLFSLNFDTKARYNTSDTVNSGTVTLGSDGMAIATGTTSASRQNLEYLGAGVDFLLFDRSPCFSAMFSVNTTVASGSADSFIGISKINICNANAFDYTVNHVGFKVIKTGGTCKLYGTVGNGSTETATAALTDVANNDELEVFFQMNGNSSVDFYWSLNGGAMSSATNVATNVPSAGTTAAELQFAVGNHATAQNFTLYMHNARYQR